MFPIVSHSHSHPDLSIYRYMGSQGIYTHTVPYERDTDCPICGSGVPLEVEADMTLQQVNGVGTPI